MKDNCALSSSHACRVLFCCLLLAALTGCRTTGGKVSRDFPAWAAPQCHGALNAARDAIQSKGTRLSAKSIRVQIIPGTRKIGNAWAWYVEEPTWPGGGMWVGGLTAGDGRLIQIVIDPARATDPAALHMGSLIHEMAHHWLITHGHGGDHPAIYDDVIPGWAEARRKLGQ